SPPHANPAEPSGRALCPPLGDHPSADGSPLRPLPGWFDAGRSRAGIAWAELAQVLERIDAARMAVIPKKLHGVAADQLRLLELQPLRAEHRKWGLGFRGRGMLVRAHRAGALVAKLGIKVNALVAVGPLHCHRVVSGGNLD